MIAKAPISTLAVDTGLKAKQHFLKVRLKQKRAVYRWGSTQRKE
jgi:hypothetical protein